MASRIQYAETSDGVSIAFWSMGEGIPLVYLPRPGFSHLQLEWQIDEMRRWYEALAKFCRLTRYDGRGTGLSDRDVDDLSVEAQVRDLEAVVDKLGLDRFATFAPTFQGLVAVQYAAAHPERVSHMVLWCMAPRGADQRGGKAAVMRELLDTDWELYTRTVAHEMLGWPQGEAAERFAKFMRDGVSQETMKAALEAYERTDVTDLLPSVQAATAVIYRREIVWPGVDQTRKLVAKIPNAHLVLLEGTSIAPFLGDTDSVVRAVEECLAEEAPEVKPRATASPSIATPAAPPELRFCTSADGTRIAYATAGEGPAVIQVPGWITNTREIWRGADYQEHLRELTKEHQVVRFDRRGVASSQRDVDDVGMDSQVEDILALADHLGFDRFALDGTIDGAAVCVALAARYPERVTRLTLVGAYASGEDMGGYEKARGLIELIRTNWPLACRTLVAAGDPRGEAHPIPRAWAAESERERARMIERTHSPEIAAKYVEFYSTLDVSGLAPHVETPALVVQTEERHRARGTTRLAGLMPNARLVAASGAHFSEERARQINEFLNEPLPERRPIAAAPARPATPPGIRYATSADGTKIAYTVRGGGPHTPVLHVNAWYVPETGPISQPIVERLQADRAYIHYARRGLGASQRDVSDVSLDQQVADLEAVVAHAGLAEFDLIGFVDGGPVCLAYAARHPGRVRKLALWGSFARGPDHTRPEAAERLAALIRSDWSAARSRMVLDIAGKGSSGDEVRKRSDNFRHAVSPEVAAKYVEHIPRIDVTDHLANVRIPVLVMHAPNDPVDPFAAGQALAASLPDARFVPLEDADPFVPTGGRTPDIIIEFLDGVRPAPPPGPTISGPGIRYASSADGTRIAYTVFGSGSGTPLIVNRGWGSSIELDDEFPLAREFYRSLSEGRVVVRPDLRGIGLSQRDPASFSLDAFVADIDALANELGLEQFDLFGFAHGAPVSAAYAARYPERINRLILWALYADGGQMWRREKLEGLADLVRGNWPLACRTIADVLFPSGPEEMRRGWARHLRDAMSPEVAVRYLQYQQGVDIRDLLPSITAPTLILHRGGDNNIPLRTGRAAAAAIPGARFHVLPGDSEVPYVDHAETVRLIREFLGDVAPAPERALAPSGVHTILFTDLASSTAITQRLGDAKAQELVRAHDGIVRQALRSFGGAEIKHTGDGIMASFASASGALECAVTLQRDVEAWNREQGTGNGEALAVHVGLNAGEPVAEGGDLFGASVQLARRLCDASEGGEIYVSDVVRALALGKGFAFEDKGEQSLKGFDEPVRAWSVVWRETSVPAGKLPDGLTPREVEVLVLIAAGRTNTEIADELVLSIRTVARHITNVYGKIGARNKAEATSYVMRKGLT